MGKRNKGKRQVFTPPVRQAPNPYSAGATYRQLQEQYNREMTEASNQAFNLAMSAALIGAKDMGFPDDLVVELSQRAFGVMDDVADNLATIDSMLQLVRSWGIPITEISKERTEKQVEALRKKTATFEILAKGIDAIEDIIKVAKERGINIDYRDACTWRWEFNQIKYWEDCKMALTVASQCIHAMREGKGKDEIMKEFSISDASYSNYKCIFNQMFTEDGQVTEKMKECWDYFERGMKVPEVIKVTKEKKYGKNFIFNAYNEWLLVKERNKPKEGRRTVDEIKETAKKAASVKTTEVMTTEEFTEKFFADKEEAGQDDTKEKITAADEDNKAGERVEEAREDEGKKEQETTSGTRVEKTPVGNGKGLEINKEFEEEIKSMEATKKKGLRPITKVVALEGDCATYVPNGDEIKVLNNKFEVVLTKKEMLDLANEMLEAVEQL